MTFPKLSNFIKKAASGATGGLLEGAKGIISQFVVDPTAKMEAEKALQELEVKHAETMANIALEADRIEADIEKSYLADLDSARKMQIAALGQDDKFSKRFVYYLATGIIILTFIFDMCFFFIQYPERNHDIVNMIAGTLNSTGFAAVIYFFFGSSKSSRDNSEAMRKHLDKTGNG